jgi:putative FmdB family regulatory protein
MPIYEYICRKCGTVITDTILTPKVIPIPPADCRCGGMFERIISPSSFVLKGEWPGKTIKGKK